MVVRAELSPPRSVFQTSSILIGPKIGQPLKTIRHDFVGRVNDVQRQFCANNRQIDVANDDLCRGEGKRIPDLYCVAKGVAGRIEAF